MTWVGGIGELEKLVNIHKSFEMAATLEDIESLLSLEVIFLKLNKMTAVQG